MKMYFFLLFLVLTTVIFGVEKVDSLFAWNNYLLSTKNTRPDPGKKRAPNGSSLLSSSGQLTEKKIKFVIHAATGSMGGGPQADLNSIKWSIENAFLLAQVKKIKKIAIPFLGGGIFFSRMGVSKEELAKVIIKACQESSKSLDIDYALVAYGDKDFNLFKKASGNSGNILKGSILNFSLHGATAIVNAANTELKFGAGLSGLISRAVGSKESAKIDRETTLLIEKFYSQ